MDVRLVETLKKQSRLDAQGFKVHTMWACDWARLLKGDAEAKRYVDSLELVDPIDIRDAYFGGRTNAIVLLKSLLLPEKAGYDDFCSLYPFVLKYRRYPVGHPVRITSDFKAPCREACIGAKCPLIACKGWHWRIPYFGLMKLRVAPPRSLRFPVLPVHCNGKLMFPLCSTCTQRESQDPCQCSDKARSLMHTWTTCEIEVALDAGYEIVHIFEVLHWVETEEIDPATGLGGLFTEYINTFLRLKAEASGYPAHAETPAQRVDYVESFLRHEGVAMNAACIRKNPGLRSIAKLALNSFYGKFGQRTNMRKCAFLRTAKDIYRFLTDYSKIIKDFHVLNGQLVCMEYTAGEEFVEVDGKTNVAVAAFCTSYARLHLWYILSRLGSRVIYHDTDSVIYTYGPDQYVPDKGQFLGQLTDELECKEVGCPGCVAGHWIVEFVSCGPKNYAYKLNSGEVVCKVRGFSLNFSASQVVNLDSMRQALVAWKSHGESPPLVTVKTMILRDKYTAVVYSRRMSKTYGVVYNKRVVDDDYNTVPYGY